MNKTMLIVIPLMLIIGAGGSYFMFSGTAGKDSGNTDVATDDDAEHAAVADVASAESSYVAMDPPMIVNILDQAGGSKFLQVTIEVMVNNTATAEAVKKHMPAIRNNLMLLFSSQTQEDINTTEGKDSLRELAQAEIMEILKLTQSPAMVQAVYFTGFVMQ
jgi:flagellar FliL protein